MLTVVAQIILRSLLENTAESLANSIKSNLARKAFTAHFSRLVIPPQESPSGSGPQDDLTSIWVSGGIRSQRNQEAHFISSRL